MGQDMPETPFPFYDEFFLHVSTCKMYENENKLNLLTTCKCILKWLVLTDLQHEVVNERNVQCVEVEEGVQIFEWDEKDVINLVEVLLSVRNHYRVKFLVIVDVEVM
jgi:hypothetical protein